VIGIAQLRSRCRKDGEKDSQSVRATRSLKSEGDYFGYSTLLIFHVIIITRRSKSPLRIVINVAVKYYYSAPFSAMKLNTFLQIFASVNLFNLRLSSHEVPRGVFNFVYKLASQKLLLLIDLCDEKKLKLNRLPCRIRGSKKSKQEM